MNTTIRSAALADAPALAQLMTQLGYPAADAELAHRLARIISTPGHTLLVAVLEGQPIGLAHGVLLPLLEDEGSAQLLALVVDEAHRSHGIGKRLVAAIEAWAGAAAARRVVVRSNIVRTRTHTFYENLGFSRTKIQLNLSKPLPPFAET
jgi:GNAT superfamily N-acetyltransferase